MPSLVLYILSKGEFYNDWNLLFLVTFLSRKSRVVRKNIEDFLIK